MRWALFIIYILAIAGGELRLLSKRPPVPPPVATIVAQRDLPQNTRIEPKDIADPRVVGRYTTQFVGRSQSIDGRALAPRPQLNLQAGEVLLVMAVGPSTVDANAGSQVHLCRAGEALGGALTVRAKLCDDGGVRCKIVLGASSDVAAALSAVKDDPRTELRPREMACK